ncbi:MAG: hypothetical protein ACI89L_002825 [Phycisphaerales bacterium]|jgi:hypothetical protein
MAKRPKPKKQLPQELNAQQALAAAQNSLNGGDYRMCAALMIQFVKAAPHFAPGHLALGLAFNRLERWPEAVERLSEAEELMRSPDQPEAPTPQVEMGRKFNEFMVATELSRALIHTGDLARAGEVLAGAVPVTDNSRTLDAHKARLELARGNAAGAAEAIRPLLSEGETDIEVAMVAAEIALAAPEAMGAGEVADHLVASSKRVGLPAGILISLLHATADVCDACGRHEDAFSAWRRAAGLPKVQFKQRAYMAEVVATMRGWTTETYSRVMRAESEDATPVLVVGMPGRGLDSVARLIASHPGAATAGATGFLAETAQYRFGAPAGANFAVLRKPGTVRATETAEAGERYTKSLRRRAGAPDADRVVDQNAVNTIQLGMLALMNPKAHVVYVKDDPFDSCFEAWSSSSAYEHPFVAEPVSLALYWRGETNLANHWAEVFASDAGRQPWFELDLRRLRESPEETARALFMFLGLEWNDQVRDAAQEAAKTRRPDAKVYRPMLKTLADSIERATIASEQPEPGEVGAETE